MPFGTPYEPPRLTTREIALPNEAQTQEVNATTPAQPLPAAVAEGIGQILAILSEECGPYAKGRLAWSLDRDAEPDKWVLFLSLPEAIQKALVSGFMLRVVREVDPAALAHLTLDFDAPRLDD